MGVEEKPECAASGPWEPDCVRAACQNPQITQPEGCVNSLYKCQKWNKITHPRVTQPRFEPHLANSTSQILSNILLIPKKAHSGCTGTQPITLVHEDEMNDTTIRVTESFSKRHDISSQGSVSHLEDWCVHGHCQSALKANLHEHTTCTTHRLCPQIWC